MNLLAKTKNIYLVEATDEGIEGFYFISLWRNFLIPIERTNLVEKDYEIDKVILKNGLFVDKTKHLDRKKHKDRQNRYYWAIDEDMLFFRGVPINSIAVGYYSIVLHY